MPSTAEKNLILVQEYGWQSINDFNAIAKLISEIAPDIETFIVNNAISNSVTRKRAAKRPTLVVSFGALRGFNTARGRICQGGYIPKPEQVKRLEAANVAVPKSAILTPELVLDTREWGKFVVLKPLARGHSSHGAGVNILRTSEVVYVQPADYPEGHPGRDGSMMVQQFINCGERLNVYRVLTLFGVPLYAFLILLDEPRQSLDTPDIDLQSVVIASNSGARQRTMVDDENVMELARNISSAFPEVPLQGCDIIRDAHSGALYALEINAGGNTWQFSSDIAKPMVEQMGGAHVLIDQFSAFDIAARVLVERTRVEAE